MNFGHQKQSELERLCSSIFKMTWNLWAASTTESVWDDLTDMGYIKLPNNLQQNICITNISSTQLASGLQVSKQAAHGRLSSVCLEMLIHAHFSVVFRILTSKVGHGGLVLVCNQGPLVDLCMQDYKSLEQQLQLVPSWLTSRYTQTDRQTDSFWLAYWLTW